MNSDGWLIIAERSKHGRETAKWEDDHDHHHQHNQKSDQDIDFSLSPESDDGD